MKKRVAEGRWEAIGAFWIEPDCNLISGESMVRQIVAWHPLLPAGVRHHAADGLDSRRVRQLLDACRRSSSSAGLKYFVTHKMSVWNDTNKWTTHSSGGKGPTARASSPCAPDPLHRHAEPDHLKDHWDRYSGKGTVGESLYCYGWGDGGGGPDRRDARILPSATAPPRGAAQPILAHRRRAWNACASWRMQRTDLPVINDELYLEEHRGVYTTKGRLKKLNRQGELLMRRTEMLSVFAGKDYPAADLDRAWKILLTTQFHDSLPGTHTTPAYQEICDMLDECYGLAQGAERKALEAIGAKVDTSGPGQPVLVFNAQSFARDTLVQVPWSGSPARVLAPGGKEIPSQLSQDFETGNPVLVFRATALPPCGYAVYHIVAGAASSVPSPVSASAEQLENQHLRIRFNAAGEIVSLFDKEAGRECIEPGQVGNQLRLFEDLPGMFDAWDIEMHYEDTEFALPPGTVELGEQGPGLLYPDRATQGPGLDFYPAGVAGPGCEAG